MIWLAAAAMALAPQVASAQATGALGKTCRGVFTLNDAPPGRQQGAFQVRFGGTSDRPTAHLWRGFGAALMQKVSNELNSGTLSTDLAGFDDLGMVENLVFSGSQISFNTRQGAGITLMYDSSVPSIYDGTALINTPTPNEPVGRFDWRGAETHILCR